MLQFDVVCVSADALTFRSAHPDVVSVTGTGRAQALNSGEAVIVGILRADTTMRATAVVTVK